MTPYRREFEKIYSKINKLAQKGSDYIYDYYNLIDEIIDNNQFAILEDVMLTKYEIQIKNFLSITEFKNFSFPEIRKQTNDSSSEALKKIINQKSVYSVGYYFYDKNTNRYLGDIREIDNPVNQIYTNTKLLNQNLIVSAEVGIPDSISASIATFENNPVLVQKYKIGDQLAYTDILFECIQSYTYSSTNRITPTYSTHWTQIKSPTYSVSYFTSSTTTLVQKYSQAIDFLKGFTYSYV